jgi:hypothetical protein
MPIGFGYVEREADSYINWADVSKGMVDTINDIQRVRDEKKQLLEETYRKDLDFLTADHTGEERSLSNWSINYGNNGAEMLKAKYNLLKQGKGTVKDFTSFRQNLVDDTDNLYTTVDKLQQIYKTKSDRRKKGESQDLEVDEMALLEQYGDLSQTEPYINDMTGAVTVGLMETVVENGQTIKRLVKDPNKFISVRGLKASANAQFDNYNPLPDINTWVEMQGDRLESFRQLGSEFQAGSITEILDITAEELAKKDPKYAQMVKEFKKSEDDYLNSLMANDYNTLAIFTNQMKFDKNGKQYKSTYNKDELTSDNMIYKERNNAGLPVPKFKEEQLAEAREWMRGQARLMYDKKVEQKTYTEAGRQYQQQQFAPGYVYDAAKENKTTQDWAVTVSNLSSDDPIARDASLQAIKNIPGVDNAYFEPTAKGINVVVIRDGKKATQPVFLNGKGVSSKTIGTGIYTAAFGTTLGNRPDEFSRLVPEKSLTKSFSATAPATKKTTEELVQQNIIPKLTSEVFQKGISTAINDINNALGDLGITISKNPTVFTNEFTASYLNPVDGKPVEKKFFTNWGKKDSQAKAKEFQDFVNDYIKLTKNSFVAKTSTTYSDLNNSLNSRFTAP